MQAQVSAPAEALRMLRNQNAGAVLVQGEEYVLIPARAWKELAEASLQGERLERRRLAEAARKKAGS